MGKEARTVCSCLSCQDLAVRYGFDVYSCFPFRTPPHRAIIPRYEPFCDKTRRDLFSIFDVPARYVYVDYTDLHNQMIRFGWKSQPPSGAGDADNVITFLCKLVDPVQRYQSGEMIVFEVGTYFFCLMHYFEKRRPGDEKIYEFVDFTDSEVARDHTALIERMLGSFERLSARTAPR